MPSSVNVVRNPEFTDGKAGPRSWVFESSGSPASWTRPTAGDVPSPAGVVVTASDAVKKAVWSQSVPCKPGEYYRVEVVATCDLVAEDDTAGLVLSVQPIADDKPCGQRKVTPAIHKAADPITIRATYHAPDGVRRLKISVGLVNARGTASIREVRFIKILEPDEVAHAPAIPPPPYTVDSPYGVDTVCVCSADASDRPLTNILSEYFGPKHVHGMAPSALRLDNAKADAILLPDPSPPASLRSLKNLLKLASRRVVVISLAAFRKINPTVVSLRRIEQKDDPTYAKVVLANHATRGFALHDTFVFGSTGKTPGSFVQNQFRRSPALRSFCESNGFETLLVSMCDQESTSDRAISLYKDTPHGALVVLDLDPLEVDLSTAAEPVLGVHLLLNILGRSQTDVGQFAAPARREAIFRGVLREMATRFDYFVVHDDDAPIDEITHQLVTIGREDLSCGMPLQPKPVILVRSGLTSGDVAAAYGALLWFKQLVRMEPYACPYTFQLASQFRLAWIPSVAPWEAPDGWQRSGQPPAEPMAIDTEDAPVAALIDLVSAPVNRTRVVVPDDRGTYERYFTWLPEFSRALGPGPFFAPAPPEGAGFANRDRFSWEKTGHHVEVVADADAFDDVAHRDVIRAGGDVVRIEIPGSDADFTAYSIQRTGIAATVLEHVVGLQFGLIGINRGTDAIQLNGFPPVNPGELLIMDRLDPMLQEKACRVG